MDILDLSIGEKKSRRKAHVPQRRLAVTEGAATYEASQDSSPSYGDDLNKQRKINLYNTPRLRENFPANDERKYSPGPDYQNRNLFPDDHCPTDQNSNLVLSPISNQSNGDSGGRCLDGVSRTPSPNLLLSSSGSSGKSLSECSASYLGNSNANNNVNRNLALPETVDLQHPVKGISALPAFQERYGSLSAAVPRSLMATAGNSIPDSSFDVQPIDTPGIPERTKKQNRWAFNVWREWARKRNLTCESMSGTFIKVPVDVGKATEAELDYWLSKFVKEIRRKDGNPYPPHTLMQIVMGIQRYLRQQAGRPSICILDRSNPAYGRFRSVLDSRIKELTNDGVTSSHKVGRRSSLPASSPNLSSLTNYPDQTVLWNAGIIGSDTALGLLNAVFFHNTVTFGIRNIDDHWNLKMSHFVVGNRGQQAQSYIEFVPSRDPIYVNRGLSKDCRIYAEPGNPRCVVKLFQKYMSLVPPDGAFYRHPQEPTLVDRSIRFSDQWVGKNRLRAMIKHVFDSTRLDGRDRHQGSAVSAPTLSSHKYPLNKYNLPPSQNESSMLTTNVYDRLAQVMMQLSHMRSSPHQMQGAGSEMSSHNATPSPKPEATGNEPSVSIKEEATSNHGGSPESLSSESELTGMKRRSSCDEPPTKRLRVNDACDADDVKVTSSCEKQIDENMLEIAVPRAITAVTIVRGSRRITIQLD